jgi:hypothetical protein
LKERYREGYVTGRRERRRKQLPHDLNEAEDMGNGKRKHYISLSGKLAFEDDWTCRKREYGMNAYI